MTDLTDIEAVIENLKSYNSDEHEKLSPDRLSGYARQAALAVLLSNWEVALRNGGTTLNNLFHDIDVTVDKLEAIKGHLRVDIDYLRDLNSDENESFGPTELSDYARQAAMSVLIGNWEQAIRDHYIHNPADSYSVFKSEMERDVLYTRADLLKIRAIMQADYKPVLDDHIEEQPKPKI